MGALTLIDQVAQWWIDWRIDRAAKADPDLQLKKLEYHDNQVQMVFKDSPGILMLAYEASQMLGDSENYIEFEMMPRLTSGLKPIVVTLRWKSGLTPSEKAAQLQEELNELRKEKEHDVTNN